MSTSKILTDIGWDLGWWVGIRLKNIHRDDLWSSFAGGAVIASRGVLRFHLRSAPKKVRADVSRSIKAGLRSALKAV